MRVTTTPKSPRQAVKVVASVRKGDKVSQKIVRHIGIALDDHEVVKLKQIAYEYIASEKNKTNSQQRKIFEDIPISSQAQNIAKNSESRKLGRPKKLSLVEVIPVHQVALTDVVESQRVVEGVHEVAGHIYDALGYHEIMATKKEQRILKDLVIGRLVAPYSKHKLHKILSKKFGKSHDLDTIYRTLDKLHDKIDQVKSITFLKTQSLFPGPVDLAFFDVTTLYFESVTTDELREFGYSKDHRFNTTQVVLALATNQDGLPIGYELFSGNTAEVSTLLQALESWKQSFQIKDVCFVGDRAMFCEKNIKLLEERQYKYVIAAKLKSLPEVIQNNILDPSNYHCLQLRGELAFAAEFDLAGRRLIVTHKQSRADRDQAKRQEILDKITKTLGKESSSKKAITNNGIKKYTTTDTDAKTILDTAKIAADADWDGLHGVISNLKEDSISAIIGRYARLWVIEESFRINKHSLAMRPIYHFKPERIKAHIALCYMSFTTLRHLQYRAGIMTKISIDDVLEELMAVQASIYVHKQTGHKYRVPGAFSQAAGKIYKCLGLTRNLDASYLI